MADNIVGNGFDLKVTFLYGWRDDMESGANSDAALQLEVHYGDDEIHYRCCLITFTFVELMMFTLSRHRGWQVLIKLCFTWELYLIVVLHKAVSYDCLTCLYVRGKAKETHMCSINRISLS